MFSRKKSVLLFLLPGLLMILVFYIIPFAGGVAYSMTGRIYNPEMGVTQTKFVALNNYEKLWKNQMFQLGLKNTLELSALCTPILWSLSLVISVFLEESIDSSSFFRSSTLLPYLLPSSAMLLIWLVAFDYGGPINRINEMLGFDRVMWLESAALRTPIILMFIWKNLGFCIIIFSAALQAIPQSLYEYAILEGAGFLTRVFRITLPLITPSAFLIFVLAWVKGHTLELPIKLAAFYGLRRSEVLGLKWNAIDFDANTITIRHTVTACNLDGKHIEVVTDSTKTKSSMRTLPLVPEFRELLLQKKEQQEHYRKLCGRSYCTDYLDYICVNEIGERLKPNTLSNGFKRILEQNNLRVIRLHDLRHTCASLLLANGVPMKQIQEWLGHSDFSTTANIYAHLDYHSKLSSAEAMLTGLGLAHPNPENG